MPMRFSYEELKLATHNFHKRLGEGGFGSVFEGERIRPREALPTWLVGMVGVILLASKDDDHGYMMQWQQGLSNTWKARIVARRMDQLEGGVSWTKRGEVEGRFFSYKLPLHQFGIRARFVRDINMPPKRRVPNRIPVEEANERDRVAQLEQQMAQITEQLATLIANQNPFHALNPNASAVEDESNEESESQVEIPQQRRQAPKRDDSRRWESGMRTEIPEFQGNLSPEEFLDWLGVVEEILEFKNVPANARVALVATRLRGRAAAWWQQLKLTRTRMGKTKITDWEKVVRKLRAEFLPHNFQRLMYQKLQNLRQGLRTVDDYITEFYQLIVRNDIQETQDQLVSRYCGGLRAQIMEVVNLFDPITVSEAHQRALQIEKETWEGNNSTSSRPAAVGSSSSTPNIFSALNQQPRTAGGFKCFNCGEVGHRQSECKKLGKRVLFTETDEGNADDAVIRGEPQFDEDDEVIENWVEGDVGPLLMARPVYDARSFIAKAVELEKDELMACKLEKEELMAGGTGFKDVPTDCGTTMVVQRTCLAPRADESDWLRNNVFHSTSIMLNLNAIENRDFLVVDGFLFHGNQLCVPDSSLRFQIIKELHGEGHVGRDRTLQLVKSNYFWPTIRREVERYMVNTQLNFSSAYHPQTDGQTEVVNRSLGNLLRCLVGDNACAWDQKISQAEFAHNHAVNRSTGFSPFQDTHAQVYENLGRTVGKYKLAADKKRKHLEFGIGDFVWAILTKDRFPVGDYNKLAAKKIGPLEILEKINPNAYRLRLPSHIRTADVFNVKHLIPYSGDSSGEDTDCTPRSKFLHPGGDDAVATRALEYLESKDRCKTDGPAGRRRFSRISFRYTTIRPWKCFLEFFMFLYFAHLLAAQYNDYPSAHLPTSWTNNALSAVARTHITYQSHSDFIMRIILLKQPHASSQIGFACGFVFDLSTRSSFLATASVRYSNHSGNFEDVEVFCLANRRRPVHENATLQLQTDGDLILRDVDGTLVWSTNTSHMSVAGLQMLKTGNLVLYDDNNKTIWQSFDHPTDTLLPGQKLMVGQKLVARASATDWNEGSFYLTVTSEGLFAFYRSTVPQMYLNYKVSEIKESDQPSYIRAVNGRLALYILSAEPSEPDDVFLTPVDYTEDAYMRLDPDGHFRFYNDSMEPVDILADFLRECDYPTVCGNYGLCSNGQCSCPAGYVNDSVSGYFQCTATYPTTCENPNSQSLLQLEGVYYFNYVDPDAADLKGIHINSCKEACLRTCSCKAAMFRFYYNISHGNCFLLSDVLSLINEGKETNSYKSYAFIKRPNDQELQRHSSASAPQSRAIAGVTVGTFVLVVLVVGFCILCLRKKRNTDGDVEDYLDQLSGMPTRFSYQELKLATENFQKKLGEGGFGSVFEGTLVSGEKVAAKRSVVTEKADVYSFGIVVMAVVCGRKNLDRSQSEECMHLLPFFMKKAEEDCLIDLVDKYSEDMQLHAAEVVQMMRVAVWCLQNDYTRRPSMSTVVKVLEGTMDFEASLAATIREADEQFGATMSELLPSILSGPR
ncbi:hypothetical protein JRO89_XS06G0037300 [Xanthoceras sorbifolium]|uniref:Uncharacterized protein n=1 Tax=Xanthoceras sorbifolium TaxID=99658 RepID=A0ABQ8HWU3_9ROSI|nr:hypothetical protein JRO89_XS06G0037300 [Xanthoceras sorbifolium]